MPTTTAAGASLAIGPADETAAGLTAFEGLAYTAISNVETIGDIGERFTAVNYTVLDTREEQTDKGSKTAPLINPTIVRDSGDAGQTALRAAKESDSQFAFRVTLNDEGSGSPSNPTTIYFRGLVMDATDSVPDANNMVRLNTEIKIIPGSVVVQDAV